MVNFNNNKQLDQFEKEAESSMPFLGSDEKNLNTKDPVQLQQLDQANTTSVVKTATAAAGSGSSSNDNIVLKVKEVKPWIHFVAGGIGGMAGAIATCPLDVVKTRLQSDVYRTTYNSSIKSSNPVIQSAQHFKETFSILGNVYKTEGFRALFKGLGPNLVGVIPARSINFFTYGISKQFISKNFNNNNEATWIHLLSAANAGIVTSTATNPIWLVKTRLQLDKFNKHNKRQYKNSIDCFVKVLKNEGIGALYKGLSASYLGSAEGVIQWTLYEQSKSFLLKRSIKNSERDPHYKKTKLDYFNEWAARSGSAGFAKFVASIITYPHEVVRTRLRQAPQENGKPKYTGIVQCFKLIVKQEGLASMYGGLTPHLLRTVPNSIIMFGTWEILIKFLSDAF